MTDYNDSLIGYSEIIEDDLGGKVFLTKEMRQREIEGSFVYISKEMAVSLKRAEAEALAAYNKESDEYVRKHHPEWRNETLLIIGSDCL